MMVELYTFALLYLFVFLHFFYIKRCIALCTAKLRARVCNGGYFQMMVGGSLLPGQPLEPLLSPQPSASSHLNMSNPQKYPLPGQKPFSPQISFQPTGGLIRLPRPQCIYSLHLQHSSVYQGSTHLHSLCIVCEHPLSIHGSIYTSPYLSGYYPTDQPRVDPFHFKLF